MFILRLYVLEGCPSCQQAIQFIQSKRIPFEVIISNNDPVIKAGNVALNGGEDKYPVLLYNTTKELVVGFDGGKYAKICDSAAVLFGGQSWSISSHPEQSNGEAAPQIAETATGTK